MTRILGLSGSLRHASYNTGLLRAAAKPAPDGVTISAGSIRDVPLYDGDKEAEAGLKLFVGKPVAVIGASPGDDSRLPCSP